MRGGLAGPRLHLRRINEKSALCGWLRARYAARNPKPCVCIGFKDGYEEWFAALSKSVRQNIRTANNRLERDGREAELKIGVGCRPDDAEWREIIEVHRKRYFLRDGVKTGPITDWIRRNHDPIEKLLRNSEHSFLARLYIDGRLAAFFNGLMSGDGRTASIFRLSIDDDFAFYSPGILLISRAIERLAATSDITNIDLCFGAQQYKYTMGGVETLDYDFIC